jgi:biopolymer transport protein ExbD
VSLKRQRDNQAPIIDLTGASDIIFTLLLFYILTQNFLPTIKVELPKLLSETSQNETAIVLQVNKIGQIFIKDKTIRSEYLTEDLKAILQSNPASATITILTDKEAPAGISIQILDRLQKLGARKVMFQGKPSPDG